MSVLDEAANVVEDRGVKYGDAGDNARRWAQIVSAATGLNVQPHHLPVMLVALKLVRLHAGYHRDSWVDVAGYARVAEMIEGDSGGLGCSPFTDRETS